MEALFDLLKFAVRQRLAFTEAVELLKQVLTFKVPFTKIGATFLAAIELFTASILDTPKTPRGPALDLTGYEVIFEDQFDGDAVDTDVWKVSDGGTSCGWEDPSALTVKDGMLTISTEYRNGEKGEGWYTGELRLHEMYCKGYFEIRCKAYPNRARGDFWSAFWISVFGEYDPDISKGGPGGCEVDIEWFADNDQGYHVPRAITPAVWLNGADDDPEIDGINFGQYRVPDPATQFNTYGIMWTDTEYIWYINGVEAMRTSYAKGVSEVPEEIIISMCTPAKSTNLPRTPEDPVDEYVIDYVRIWQRTA